MSHGYTISPDGPDPFVELADRAIGKIFAEACQSGKWLVDAVPLSLQYFLLCYRDSDRIVPSC